jgi:hypothetical protein
MDFFSKKMQKFSMKASGMSDEAIKDMERQQEEMERAYKTGGPTAAQDAYMKQMDEMMKKATANMSGANMSIADELTKLAKLKEQGVLSESEFERMKQELIKRMT